MIPARKGVGGEGRGKRKGERKEKRRETGKRREISPVIWE